MKDPAFLFYSKDYYEGTRMMLPEERACYLDLLVYQHQNEFIPNDMHRLSMYCSGISKDIIKATLEAKFKLCDKGWLNEKLSIVISERKEFSSKQSLNGKIGQFWKKSKSILNINEYNELKNILGKYTNEKLLEKISNIDIKDEEKLKAMLKAMLKHLEDVIEDVIVIKDKPLDYTLPITENKNDLIFNELSISESWLENTAMQSKAKFKPNEVKVFLKKYNDMLNVQFEIKNNKTEYCTHFINWLNKQEKPTQTKKQPLL